jgi:hypothetical protein
MVARDLLILFSMASGQLILGGPSSNHICFIAVVFLIAYFTKKI